MEKIRAVVFDLYGALIHLPRHKAFAKLFRDLNLSKEEKHNAKIIAMTETFDTVSDLVARIDPNAKRGLSDFSQYERQISEEVASVRPYPETYEALSTLKRKHISMGVISNLGSPFIDPFYTAGLKQWISMRVFSCHVGMVKPDPEIYRLMLRSLDEAPEHVLMVGDKQRNDVDGPKSVGIHALLIDRARKTPGSIGSLMDIVHYL